MAEESKNRMVDRLLTDLGNEMGIGGLVFDESDSCLLQFDEKITVLLLYEGRENVIYLFSYVGSLPEDERKSNVMLIKMMGANYRWQEAGGATLSIRPGDNDVVLTRKMEMDAIDINKLKSAVSDFVLAQEKWAVEMANGAAARPAGAEGKPAGKNEKPESGGKSPAGAIRA